MVVWTLEYMSWEQGFNVEMLSMQIALIVEWGWHLLIFKNI